MEDILHRLYSFPPDSTSHEIQETHARNFQNSISELLPNIVDGSDKSQNLLDLLDPSTHSLSYLLVLNFYIVEIKKKSHNTIADSLRPNDPLWSRALLLLNNFDPAQIRYAASEWCNLLDAISKGAEIENKPFIVVRPIKNAILKMDPTCSSLTIAHVHLTRMCLLARAYKIARPVIDQTIFSIPSEVDRLYNQRSQNDSDNKAVVHRYSFEPPAKFTYVDHLRYFLYGGMIYMALKEWSKARHFLSIVISSPVVNAVSFVMVEAYKKWVLVNLLEKGTIASLPRITSPLASKAYKALGRPYDALASAFTSGKWNKLRDEAEVGQTIWLNDNNNGLIQQVLLSFQKQAVRGLGTTFAAVTTIDVSQRALLDNMDVLETERYILTLAVQEGLSTSLVHSSKDPKSSMLRFLTGHMEPSLDAEASLEEQLRLQHQKLELLIHNVQVSDRKLELSKEYVNHLRKSQKRNEASSKDSGLGGRKKDQTIDIDEDIMDELQ